MYVVTVIPIKKGLQKEYLTYFSSSLIPLGTIITVPVRSKDIDALVVALEDARSMKSDIKGADFQLKKVSSIKGVSPFSESFLIACDRMKDYTASTTGSVMNALLPSVYLENVSSLETSKNTRIETRTSMKHEKLVFQAPYDERMGFYRTLIREAFAKKESIFICVPTRYDIAHIRAALTKGIEQYVFTFESGMPKKTLLEAYNRAILDEHPILIIGTGMFLSLPRTDIHTLILEHESSESYKGLARPFIDIRSFAEVLASITQTKLILGDTLLRPETLHRHDSGEFGEVASPSFRLGSVDRQYVVDMREEVDEKGKKIFNVLSDTVQKMIAYAQAHSENVFLFSVRKGLAGVTVCNDCGSTLACPNCSTPMVLYKARSKDRNNQQERIYVCNKCGERGDSHVRCKECSSWNLVPLGIGTDRVYDEVKELFPEATVVQIDKESTPTEREIKKALTEFKKIPGSILIGTEMAFSYLEDEVTHSALISLDGLLSIPSFNITQKVLHVIEKLESITERTLVIQTRMPDNDILRHVISGNVLPLYREDLNERRTFGYPPFKRLIKITFAGTPTETEKARKFIDHILGGYDPQVFSAFKSKTAGHYITNTVIKVDPNAWKLPLQGKISETSHLHEALSRIPPAFAVNVDPEDLL